MEDHSKLVEELRELIGTSEALLRRGKASRGAHTPEGPYSFSLDTSSLSDSSYHSHSVYSAPPAHVRPDAGVSFSTSYRSGTPGEPGFLTPAGPLAASSLAGAASSPINPDLAHHKPLLQYMLDDAYIRNAEFQRLEGEWQQQKQRRRGLLERGSHDRDSAVRNSTARVIRRICAAQEQVEVLSVKSFNSAIDRRFQSIFQPMQREPSSRRGASGSSGRGSPLQVQSGSFSLSPPRTGVTSPCSANKRRRPSAAASPPRSRSPMHRSRSSQAHAARFADLSSGNRKPDLFVCTAAQSSSASGPSQSPAYNPMSSPSSTPSYRNNTAFV